MESILSCYASYYCGVILCVCIQDCELHYAAPYHPLQHYLTPGEDDFYYQNRDYMVNDVAPLGEGGFGTCVLGQNRSNESVFAMKRNNRDDEDKIESIRSECRMLARIRSHDNVIKFLGAVVDDEDEGYPPRVCKMFMELAESKSTKSSCTIPTQEFVGANQTPTPR